MINKLTSIQPVVTPQVNAPVSTVKTEGTFGQFLTNAIQDLNAKQVQSDVMTEKLINGENVELHNVMIAAQKANVSMTLAIEVRNKVLEAYQEVMRMQV